MPRGIYEHRRKPFVPGAIVDADTVTIVLSERKRKVIQMLADGLNVKEIAWIQGMSIGGVKWIVDDLYKRLGINSRVRLVRLAIRKGWVKA